MEQQIQTFFQQTNKSEETYLPKAIILEKIEWLKKLIYSIEHGSEFNTENKSLLQEWLSEETFLSKDKRVFFEDLEKRILINAQNLFHFLKREEYLEILPLYTSLLEIYKLTLMMNNAITIEYANQVIEGMKLDKLTGLFRKEIFEELLKKEISLINREDTCFSVVYIDIDDFKFINDNYGHYSGDKVIEEIGNIIKKNIRLSDFGFRIGGDEFALILKKATEKEAKIICEKIKSSTSNKRFSFNEKVDFHVTLSIGIAEYNKSKKLNLIELLNIVDKNLYLSKKKGKNTISY